MFTRVLFYCALGSTSTREAGGKVVRCSRTFCRGKRRYMWPCSMGRHTAHSIASENLIGLAISAHRPPPSSPPPGAWLGQGGAICASVINHTLLSTRRLLQLKPSRFKGDLPVCVCVCVCVCLCVCGGCASTHVSHCTVWTAANSLWSA